jgi:hypothetical protein
MAKDRLGRLRKHAEADQMTNGCWVRELLADRDHWEEQAKANALDGEMDVTLLRAAAKRLAVAATGDDAAPWDGPQVISFALGAGRSEIDRLRAELSKSNRERDEAQLLCSSVQNEGFELVWATKPHKYVTGWVCTGKRRAAFLFGDTAAARLYPEEGDQ